MADDHVKFAHSLRSLGDTVEFVCQSLGEILPDDPRISIVRHSAQEFSDIGEALEKAPPQIVEVVAGRPDWGAAAMRIEAASERLRRGASFVPSADDASAAFGDVQSILLEVLPGDPDVEGIPMRPTEVPRMEFVNLVLAAAQADPSLTGRRFEDDDDVV